MEVQDAEDGKINDSKDNSQSVDITATCDISEPTEPQCYCNQPRNYMLPELQCGSCSKWFHLKCIKYNVGVFHAFSTSYHFTCQLCSGEGEEKFARKNANFPMMCQTAMANLMVKHQGQVCFSKEKHILPYLEEFWDELASMPRKTNNSWHAAIHKILTSSELFRCVKTEGEDIFVSLTNADVSKVGPSYERFLALASQFKTGPSSSAMLNAPSGSRKRRLQQQQSQQGAGSSGFSGANAAGSNASLMSSGGAASGLDASDGSREVSKMLRQGSSNASLLEDNLGAATNGAGSATTSGGGATLATGSTSAIMPLTGPGGIAATAAAAGKLRLNPCGFPMDYPFNKDSYRYILVEPDPHAPGRQLWDANEATAGKPIPGFFYRVFLHGGVLLSCNDRASQLKLHPTQMSVTGEKGYCMVRGTHGVARGSWYFEVKVQEQPEGGHARIGWAQLLANLHTPCGFDKFGYSWRSRKGTVFHDSIGKHYASRGYGKDDVIGCLIHLPDLLEDWPANMRQSQPLTMSELLPPNYKDRPLIKFKNHYYFEEKDDTANAQKNLRPLEGAKIIFYRNGECQGVAFRNIYAGCYFPAISLYKSVTVAVNFGPDFEYPPTDQSGWRPICERATDLEVDQALSDLLHLVDKETTVKKQLGR